MTVALIADIGGTNVRFGLVDKNGLRDLQYLECSKFVGPSEAAKFYLDSLSLKEQPEIGVFAVAGPVMGDLINFTNIPWAFRVSAVQKELNLKRFEVMNDFKAVALAIPGIDPKFLHKVGGSGEPMEHAPKGVIGPGTGLGVAFLSWEGERYRAQPGEGGHVTMAPVNDREFNIFRQLHVKYHHISAERVCSGKGLENLYNAIKVLDGKYELPDYSAPEISEKAINNDCEVCEEALDMMLSFLGRVSGNLALTLNAQGGIYIAGGIPTKLGNYFFESQFLDQFQAKGRMSELMKQIPVYLIKHDAIGLLGLEQRALSQLG